MLASLKKANDILLKEMNDYHKREKEILKKEAELFTIVSDNKQLKDDVEELRLKNL